MNPVIAVVEDDEDIQLLEMNTLQKEGFTVNAFSNGEDFMKSLYQQKPDFQFIILDLMLPGKSGLGILKIIRNSPDYEKYAKIPIIIVSAKDTEVDRIMGLELGADDYISKPFSTREMLARVKSVMRRTDGKIESTKGPIIKISGLIIDEQKYVVTIDHQVVELTQAEFKILQILAKRKGWVYDRNKLIDMIWGGEKNVTDRTIDVHVKHLREKLGKYGDLIKTLRGIGYKLEE